VDWPGWEQQVLKAGGWPVTPENVLFLQKWHSYEGSVCANNPLNTTLMVSGSANCVHVSGTIWVQRYPTTAKGTTATVDTLKGLRYLNIVAALKTGDPFAYPLSAEVAAEITTWGTPNFAAWYLNQIGVVGSSTGPSGGATTAPGAVAPTGHHGWADLRNSVNRHLPTQMQRSQALRKAALRTLGARAKVGR
jgi:hypothetical protein